MPIDFDSLKASPRILIQAALAPVAGSRIQPTGFPDLGAATYDAPDGKGGLISMLLVESAQSMANRLEAVCWDEGADELVPELKGLPYIRVKLVGLGDGTDTTTSIQEFHRLNSPYILQKKKDKTRTFTMTDDRWFREVIRGELGLADRVETSDEDGEGDGEKGQVEGVINLRRLAKVCFKYDPNSLVHGVFLEKIAGPLRHPRVLSGFIEATGVRRAESGGVKFDRALPAPKIKKLDAKEGFGNVPFHRTEFTAETITAYFDIDLAQIRGYGLGDQVYKLLVGLSLWKVRQFLDGPMTLRTACKLRHVDDEKPIVAKTPKNFALPDAGDLTSEVKVLIAGCEALFANPVVTELKWVGIVKPIASGKVEIDLPSILPSPGPFAETLKGLVEYKETGKGKKKKGKLVLKKGLSEQLIADFEKAHPEHTQLSEAMRTKLSALGEEGDASTDKDEE